MGQNDTMEYIPSALAARLPAPEHIRRLFASVPRHRFLPDVMWSPDRTRYDRAADPEAWMRVAYSDQALTTQRDDGREGGMGIASSSSSAPSVMARMLTTADLSPAHRVLEVGTGTGYNAALLCQMLGSSQVTTIEIDRGIAATAQDALHTHGASPTVLAGDAETYAAGRPPAYDRIIATCSVSRVPQAWVRQTRLGGRIVTPWAPTPGAPGGVLAVLDVHAERAEGKFEGGLSFMWARGQRDPGGTPPPHQGALAESTDQQLHDPRGPWLDGERSLLLSLLMPHWKFGMGMEEGGTEPYVWVASTSAEPGWARLHADGRVEQGSGRRLADEAAAAWEQWNRWDQPDVSDFGLTVDLDRGWQTVWLHGPQHALWTMPRET
ncbi:methyltransferase domain-containing protein [Nocardiopsis sp. NPDC006938]|uniref:methyltransferase domain-containing protein n=1 Tax=Nocardiopsis sp. NPDC006938 TaxID=3364337 RepID=UPI0036862F49